MWWRNTYQGKEEMVVPLVQDRIVIRVHKEAAGLVSGGLITSGIFNPILRGRSEGSSVISEPSRLGDQGNTGVSLQTNSCLI